MRVLITGGAGFIGCNTAGRLLERGNDVILLDDMSRQGAHGNLQWLGQYDSFAVLEGDIRDYQLVERGFNEFGSVDVVLHLAAQVAVTTAMTNPREDFEVNALGTLNVLEAARQSRLRPIVLYASTNKVYGQMRNLRVIEGKSRYQYLDRPFGISEDYPLDFHSPYGCSKGAADQYVLDYARTYGLKTVSFRQSCIYGTRQFGCEDQGWVAWFAIAAALDREITIYGDGKQVRDILFVDDLTDLYLKAVERIDDISGEAYNIGGGPSNTLSLLELVELLGRLHGRAVRYRFADWRPGDQRVFISDIRKVSRDLDWEPKVCVEDGIARLHEWVEKSEGFFT